MRKCFTAKYRGNISTTETSSSMPLACVKLKHKPSSTAMVSSFPLTVIFQSWNLLPSLENMKNTYELDDVVFENVYHMPVGSILPLSSFLKLFLVFFLLCLKDQYDIWCFKKCKCVVFFLLRNNCTCFSNCISTLLEHFRMHTVQPADLCFPPVAKYSLNCILS